MRWCVSKPVWAGNLRRQWAKWTLRGSTEETAEGKLQESDFVLCGCGPAAGCFKNAVSSQSWTGRRKRVWLCCLPWQSQGDATWPSEMRCWLHCGESGLTQATQPHLPFFKERSLECVRSLRLYINILSINSHCLGLYSCQALYH